MKLYGDNGFKIELPTGNVDDVKVNGTSIVDENKVANIPIAREKLGLVFVRSDTQTGIQITGDGKLSTKLATNTDITNRNPYSNRPIAPPNFDYAVKAALTDGVGPAYTTEEQAAARTRLGVTIPTKTSDLTNDAGFITSTSLPTKTSDLTNDAGFITSTSLPTKISDLTNDAGFITSTSLPTKVSDLLNDSGFLTTANIATSLTPGVIKSGYQLNVASDGTPSCGTLTKTSYASANNSVFISKGTLANILTDYALSSNVPTKISDLTDDSNFIEDTDYATTLKGGTILLSDTYCTDTYSGALIAKIVSYSDLDNVSGNAFVSMQTMRNKLRDYLSTTQADNTFATKSSLSSAMLEVYRDLNSGLSSLAASMPHKTSDLTNDSGFAVLPWYYASEGPSVDASIAINSKLQTYKKVLLGPGDYYLSNSILVRDGCSIEGSGPQTVLHWTGVQSKSYTYSLIRILLNTTIATPDRISIKNLCIRGINESAVATNIDLTSTTESDVNKGIYVQLNDADQGTLTLDHPVIIEGIIFENLSQGFSDYLYEGSENNSYISGEKEQTSDRLVIRNCTFRNCYYGYYDNTSASASGGGVKIDNCLFNRTRRAIYVKHTGYDITNCSFYHSYYRTIETTSGWTYEPDNVPIRIMGCKFFMPADVDVAHIYAAFEGAKDVLLMVSDSFFIFGYLTSQYVKHIYSNMRIIMDGCRFMMRAEGSVLDNRLIFSFTIDSKYMSAILNSWTNVQVIPISGLPAILNSYTDNMDTFLAG